MSAPENMQAELLERYLEELEHKPNAAPPQGLDAETVQAARKLRVSYRAAEPPAAFVGMLGEQLQHQVAMLERARPIPASNRSFSRRAFVGIGAVLLLAVGAMFLFATRPPAVTAQKLLENARSAANDLDSVKVKSFQMTQKGFDLIVDDPNAPPTRSSHSETKTWYDGPNRWRMEVQSEVPNEAPYRAISVSDGDTQWDYDVRENTVRVQDADPQSFPSPSVLNLELLQEDMSNCYDPQVVGEDTIAGRAAYKVALGPAKCRSASIWWLNGPHTIWLDKETFFVLKSEIRAEQGDQVASSLEVTEIEYNKPLPNELFTFTPPPDARVDDMRPKPAPSAQDYTPQLQALAPRVAYPIFAPSFVPDGLEQLAPNWNEIENQVELGFVPPDQISSNSLPDSFGILIIEKPADYELVRNWTDGAEKFDLDGNQAWVRRGDFDPATGTGSNSAVLVLRDGVLVSVASFRLSPEQLTDVARSLEIVPGSHAPLANPTASSLAEIRAQADFPFFVPTYVPDGLAPRPPTSHEVEYERADGTVALIVMNAKQGEGGMEQDARFKGELVKLGNGTEIHQLGFEPEIMILWWYQDGGYISLEGHGISEEDMLKIAGSMSSTARLE